MLCILIVIKITNLRFIAADFSLLHMRLWKIVIGWLLSAMKCRLGFMVEQIFSRKNKTIWSNFIGIYCLCLYDSLCLLDNRIIAGTKRHLSLFLLTSTTLVNALDICDYFKSFYRTINNCFKSRKTFYQLF